MKKKCGINPDQY